MTKERQTQWHPAFCSAMWLELSEDEEYLDYQKEYNLNTKPLQIDLLIIKKLKDVEIKNQIGKLFRKYNIIEYKSPEDSLNLNTYLKVIAYACLYKTYEEHVDDVKLEDITITLVREGKPVKLFRWFRRNNYHVIKQYPGIYYIEKENHFMTQVLVSRELSKKNQKWLTLLSRELSEEDATRTAIQMSALTDKAGKMYGDSVLQVAMEENKNVFYNMKEENEIMCEALREFFADEMKEKVEALEVLEQKMADKERQLRAQSEQLNAQSEQLNAQSELLGEKERRIQELERQLNQIEK